MDATGSGQLLLDVLANMVKTMAQEDDGKALSTSLLILGSP